MFNKAKILAGGILLAAIVAGWSSRAVGGRSVAQPFSALGISSLECQCSFTIDGDRQFWVFHSEPRIKKVDRDGPSHGKLKSGDQIVAIDGKLITTRAAGRRFARVESGEEVVLTIRRRDHTFDKTIVARGGDDEVGTLLDIDDLMDSSDTSLMRLSESVEALSRFAVDLEALDEVGTLLDISDLMDSVDELGLMGDLALEDANMKLEGLREIIPRGFFGFGLSFGGSITTRDNGDPKWRFDSPPRIKFIDPDGPADRAGIEEGDVLTHIDGVRLTSREGGRRFSSAMPGQTVTWTYTRDGKQHIAETTAVERPDKYSARSKMNVRYKGTLGQTNIEVRGDKSIKVRMVKDDGKIVIETRDGVIELIPTEDDDEDE